MNARKAKPTKRMSRDEMREALSDSWASAVGVAEALKAQHPVAFQRVRLSVRTITTALLAMDREVGSLETN